MTHFPSETPGRRSQDGLSNNQNFPVDSQAAPVEGRKVPTPNLPSNAGIEKSGEFQGSKDSSDLEGVEKTQQLAKQSFQLVNQAVKTSDPIKLLVNALFDKMSIPDDVSRQTGFYGPKAQAWTSAALRNASDWEGVSQEGQACMTGLSQALARSVLLSQQMDKASNRAAKLKQKDLTPQDIYKDVSSRLMIHIQSLEAGCGEYALIPMGIPEHCMMSRVERQENGKFRVTFFNPGVGALEGGHQRDPDAANKVACALRIEDVPEDSLLQANTWCEVFNQRKEGDYLEVYKLLGRLTEGGQRVSMKKDEDPHGVSFSITQKRNTCSFALMWAVGRHELTHLSGAPPHERLMEWRVVKGHIREFLVASCDLSQVQKPVAKKVQDLANEKLKRMQIEHRLAKVAQSPENCIRFLELAGIPIDVAQNKISECATPQARMAIIRTACEEQVRNWMSELKDEEELTTSSNLRDQELQEIPIALYKYFSQEIAHISNDCMKEGLYSGMKLLPVRGESPPRVFEKYPEARLAFIEGWTEAMFPAHRGKFFGPCGRLNPKLACDYLKYCVSRPQLKDDCLQLLGVMLDWGVDQAAQHPKMWSRHLSLLQQDFLPFCERNNPILHAKCEAMLTSALDTLPDRRMDFLDGPNGLSEIAKRLQSLADAETCITVRSGMKDVAFDELQTWETIADFYEELNLDSDGFTEILEDLDKRFPGKGFRDCWDGVTLRKLPKEPFYRMELLGVLSDRLMERWAAQGGVYLNHPESGWRFDGLMQVFEAKQTAYEHFFVWVSMWTQHLSENELPSVGQHVRYLREFLGLEVEEPFELVRGMAFRSLGPWRFHILSDTLAQEKNPKVNARFVKVLKKQNPVIAKEFKLWAERNQKLEVLELLA